MANQPCNNCGSSDALQKYSDGSYCFSCHKKEFTEHGRTRRNAAESGSIRKNPELEIPYPTARNKVGGIHVLSPKMLQYSHIVSGRSLNWGSVELYSNSKQKWYTIHDCIELPIHNLEGEYVGSEYRCFSGDRKSISDYPSGTVFYSLPRDGKEAKVPIRVITEDIASSIKVSSVIPSLALLGTSLPKKCSQKLQNILKSADSFIVWLDGDKPGQDAAKKIIKTISQFAPVIQNIVTDKDPKYYSDTELEEILKPFC